MFRLNYLVAACALALTTATANASVVFEFNVDCPTCAAIGASGIFDATFEGGNEYLVTSLTGNQKLNSGQGPEILLAPGTFLGNDNLVFFPALLPFDSSGLDHSNTGGNDNILVNWSCNDVACFVTFSGVVHPATISVSAATPLPAALPLFAGGAGLIGLLARRRKRIAAAVAA